MSFTIRELETLSGIRAHTIRIWEQRYNFLKPSRTQTNIRTYNNDELKTLLSVALLNKYGYKISRIDQMVKDERAEAIIRLPQTDAYNEHLVNQLIGCMIDLENIRFEQLLNKHIDRDGIERTILQIIFPFLEKVGILWQTNKIIPVQEHVVSCIIRQKLITATDALTLTRKEEPLFLLFLPEGEHHELGLLFIQYLLRKKDLPVLYLGPNLAIRDLQYILQHKSPKYLYLHLTCFPRPQNFQKLINAIAAPGMDARVLLSGNVPTPFRKDSAQQVSVFNSFTELIGYINRL